MTATRNSNKSIGLKSEKKNPTLHMEHIFLYISLPALFFTTSTYMKLPISMFYGGKIVYVPTSGARSCLHFTSRYEHVTPLVIQLHWLPIEQRITFKIAVITFKALHGAAPSYITDLIKPYTPGRLLRSSNQLLLSTSKFNLKTYGGRSFTIAAPSVWNTLPFELRSCNSLSSFKSKLKTWLFKIGYDVVV